MGSDAGGAVEVIGFLRVMLSSFADRAKVPNPFGVL